MAPPRKMPVLRVLDEKVRKVELEPQSARPRVRAQAEARRLTLTYRLERGLPAVLVAVSGPLGGCYLTHERARAPDATILRDAGRDGLAPDAPSPDADLACDFGPGEVFFVEVPPEGVPADPALICVEPGVEVQSGLAARVTLEWDGDPSAASGTITVEAALGIVVGLPRVAEVDGWLGPVTIEDLRRDGEVYRFTARFASPLWSGWRPVSSFDRLRFEVRLELDCASGERREVVATTYVHPCDGFSGGLVFASSGEECRTCAIIAEMAPTPIIPMERADALPLQQGLRLGLRPIARFSNAVVLWAEHDQPDKNARYVWRASRGSLRRVADDIAVWVVDDLAAAAILQVAVETDTAAGVSTHRSGAAW